MKRCETVSGGESTTIEQQDIFISERSFLFLKNKIQPEALISELPPSRTDCSVDLKLLVSTPRSPPPCPIPTPAFPSSNRCGTFLAKYTWGSLVAGAHKRNSLWNWATETRGGGAGVSWWTATLQPWLRQWDMAFCEPSLLLHSSRLHCGEVNLRELYSEFKGFWPNKRAQCPPSLPAPDIHWLLSLLLITLYSSCPSQSVREELNFPGLDNASCISPATAVPIWTLLSLTLFLPQTGPLLD